MKKHNVDKNFYKKNWDLVIDYDENKIGIEDPYACFTFRNMTKLEQKLIHMAYCDGRKDGVEKLRDDFKSCLDIR